MHPLCLLYGLTAEKKTFYLSNPREISIHLECCVTPFGFPLVGDSCVFLIGDPIKD